MGITQIAFAVTAGAVLALVLKKEAPVFALMLSTALGIILIISLIPKLKSIIDIVKDITLATGDNSYTAILLKIVGITYIAQFAADICQDAGETALANKAIIAGKILTAFYGMPIIISLIEQVDFMFG